MNFSKLKKIHMIGVKGVGMTMLAQYLAENGVAVGGSDTDDKFMTDQVLFAAGVKVTEGFDEKNIPEDADLIIYSTAYNAERNPEVRKALDGKIKTLTYAEAMGEVFNQKYGVAVVGSHGKTTVTAWLAFVLKMSGQRLSAMIGSRVPQFGGSSITGASDLLIIEGDEYQNKLKFFNPKAVLLNNIDFDHPDFFQNEDAYEAVFVDFVKKIPKKGFLVANFDDARVKKIARASLGRVVSYALASDAVYVAYHLKHENGRQIFSVRMKADEEASELGDFAIQLAGRHNVYNALAVIAAAIELGVELVDIRKHLEDFAGTARRMEELGRYRGAAIIDDYAHHPTEIRATLAGVRQKYGPSRLIVVFHPHTFTRTKALLDDFAGSFDEADELIVLDIYGSAREEQGGVHSLDLVGKVKNGGRKKEQSVKHIATLADCEAYLRRNLKRGDTAVLMGAGDVFKIGESLVG